MYVESVSLKAFEKLINNAMHSKNFLACSKSAQYKGITLKIPEIGKVERSFEEITLTGFTIDLFYLIFLSSIIKSVFSSRNFD